MFNFLDAIPVVGHVKGVVHYVAGDVDAGNRAMLQSTRSTAVLGAGAVGFVAGPVGSAALGASAGALWDCAETVATDNPKGLIKDIGNIVDTAAKGEVPVVGVLQTVMTVGGDALGGMGGGSMASSLSKTAGQTAAKSVGKSVGKSTGEQILKSASVPAGETFGKSVAQSAGKSAAQAAGKSAAQSAGKSAAQAAGKSAAQAAGKSAARSLGKAVVVDAVEDAAEAVVRQVLVKTAKETIENIESTINNMQDNSSRPGSGNRSGTSGGTASGTTSGTASGAPSGGQPPQQNPNRNCSMTLTGSPWDEFFEIFNVRSLEEITIEGVRLFEGLEDHQVAYLEKLLKSLLDKNLLGTVVRILLKTLQQLGNGEVNFLNFISLCEFVMRYLEEHMKRLQAQQANVPGVFFRVTDEVIASITTNFNRHVADILNLFNDTRRQIRAQTLLINFRDEFCAVYHYFKHRIVGRQLLSVADYYGLINTNTRIIMATPEYQTLCNRGRPPVRYTRYYQAYGTRLLIVIKMQGDKIVLSTAYFKDKPDKGDQEGDTYINNRKM